MTIPILPVQVIPFISASTTTSFVYRPVCVRVVCLHGAVPSRCRVKRMVARRADLAVRAVSFALLLSLVLVCASVFVVSVCAIDMTP